MRADRELAHGQKVIHAPNDQAMLDRFADTHNHGQRTPERIAVDPKSVERDLARLVLSVIELLRKLLERQAVRRVESGTLGEEEIERLGETLLKLETRMGELKAAFGLGDRELTLDLGPLRNLVSDCE
jgi:gas vesicle protein GvpK